MNYRHIYHAGNFADVFKHWFLTLLLEKLCEKDKPFFVLDTHAGIGIYNLQDTLARKTLEQNSGIRKLLGKKLDSEFHAYSKQISAQPQPITTYPGSPIIIQDFLRTNDRLFAAELHPEDFISLQANFSDDRRVKLLQQDGYAAIKALLPPQEKRGLIFIDPPFEKTDEFAQIISALEAGLIRFANGIYAVWYPIKERHEIMKFYRAVTNLTVKSALAVEFHTNEAMSNQLDACGMLIINPPWQLTEKLNSGLPKLIDYLEFTQGKYILTWLKTE